MTAEPLFVYGTLLVPEIARAVVGRVPPSLPAVLFDHARVTVEGCVYPAVTPRRGERVSGAVYLDLSPEELERLDAYEGELYQRRRVRISVNDTLDEALCYVVRPECVDRLSTRPWDLETFVREHGRSFRVTWE